ncbi:MAG: peptide chain release factor 1 [Candidatus Margulisbacteria bacterium]|nr:peptide chain release factor 1 [Candidatus Margulisiibacteriota bacterium]
MDLSEKFKELEHKFALIESEMSNPETISNLDRYRELNIKRMELEEPVNKYREYTKLAQELYDTRELLNSSSDKDMMALAKDELDALQKKEEILKQELTFMLIPTDPHDKKNVYLEIRSGTGGEEAALFARDLYEMYIRYAARRNWQVEVVDMAEADAGGFAKVVVYIQGLNVFGRLKFESGTHRVQRVPVTEASGRIHTSAATVAIIHEADEVDVKIDPKDLKIDTYRSSGAGGQHVNKTESAIRITHIPSGLIVSCQEDRSQHKNRDKAMKLLAAKLVEMEEENRNKKESETRKMQVGSGDRSEKIRTYNYPQGRVTDHRIGLTLYRLESIMQGDIDEIIDALITADRLEKLKNI